MGENGGKNGASAAIPADDPLLLATRRELEAAGMLERYQGQLALRLAQEVVKVSLYGSGAELARVSKAFGETWASAMKAPASLSPGLGVVDELTDVGRNAADARHSVQPNRLRHYDLRMSDASVAARELARQRWGNQRPDRLAAEVATRASELSPDVRAALTRALGEPTDRTDEGEGGA